MTGEQFIREWNAAMRQFPSNEAVVRALELDLQRRQAELREGVRRAMATGTLTARRPPRRTGRLHGE